MGDGILFSEESEPKLKVVELVLQGVVLLLLQDAGETHPFISCPSGNPAGLSHIQKPSTSDHVYCCHPVVSHGCFSLISG